MIRFSLIKQNDALEAVKCNGYALQHVLEIDLFRLIAVKFNTVISE